MSHKMAEPSERPGFFLCPVSYPNHFNIQPDEEKVNENSACDPHPTQLKRQATLSKAPQMA